VLLRVLVLRVLVLLDLPLSLPLSLPLLLDLLLLLLTGRPSVLIYELLDEIMDFGYPQNMVSCSCCGSCC